MKYSHRQTKYIAK